MKVRTLFTVIVAAALVVSLTGCMNMPTEPGQIVGMPMGIGNYGRMSCSELNAHLNNLQRQEVLLAQAQSQRIKSSQVQAFWVGYGQGDGLEAAQLAIARGEKEAVLSAMVTCR